MRKKQSGLLRSSAVHCHGTDNCLWLICSIDIGNNPPDFKFIGRTTSGLAAS